MNKTLGVLFLLIPLCFLLTGCFDRREIDDETYVIAIGLDKGTVEPLKLTLQYAIPAALGSGGGSSGGSQGQKNLNTITIDSPTLISGLNMANGFIGKRINLSHAVAMVFSKELAKDGISRYIFGVVRDREFRPGIHIVVCKESAESYLNSISPIQESDPSKYYELLFSEYKNTGLISDTSFFEIQNAIKSIDYQPVATLAGLSKYKSSKEFDIRNSTASKKGRKIPLEGDFTAGSLPKVGNQEGEVMGLAVFNGDKMVGEFDGEECRDYLMITGKFKSSYMTVPDPLVKNKFIVLNVKQSRKPDMKVELNSDKPKLTANVRLEADFWSIQSGINYEDPKKLKIAESCIENFITQSISSFLDRTIHNYGSDICGFGKVAKKNFLTYNEWKDYKWLDKYRNSTFYVNVDFQIRRPGLLIRTAPTVNDEEMELSK